MDLDRLGERPQIKGGKGMLLGKGGDCHSLGIYIGPPWGSPRTPVGTRVTNYLKVY